MGTAASTCPRCGSPTRQIGAEFVCQARDCRHQADQPQGNLGEDYVRLMLRAAYGEGRTAPDDADHYTRAQMVAEDILNSYHRRPSGGPPEQAMGTYEAFNGKFYIAGAEVPEVAYWRHVEVLRAIRDHREDSRPFATPEDNRLWALLES